MNIPATQPSTRWHVAVATFVPCAAPVVIADHMAMAKMWHEIFGNLCLCGLDVPSELYTGHTGIGACHAGAKQDCVMTFEVADRARGLQVIQDALAAVGITPAHYEIAARKRLAPNYESVWLPPVRHSLLHGLSQDQVLAEIKRRLEGMTVLTEAQFPPMVLHLQAFQQSIENALCHLPAALVNDEAFCISKFRAFQATLGNHLRDFPVNIAPELHGLHEWRGALERFISTPAEQTEQHGPAFQELLAAITVLIRSLPKPP